MCNANNKNVVSERETKNKNLFETEENNLAFLNIFEEEKTNKFVSTRTSFFEIETKKISG